MASNKRKIDATHWLFESSSIINVWTESSLIWIFWVFAINDALNSKPMGWQSIFILQSTFIAFTGTLIEACKKIMMGEKLQNGDYRNLTFKNLRYSYGRAKKIVKSCAQLKGNYVSLKKMAIDQEDDIGMHSPQKMIE